jgi:hypothetical protein
MRAGQRPMDAIEDIIRQGASELRKRAFGEDADDARSLLWSREQAWAVFRALASRDTVPYHETLMNTPFKGDEGALRSMVQAELITVEALDGRPSAIRPGRPIYRYVFRRLVNGSAPLGRFPVAQAHVFYLDPVFQATQDINFNVKLVESAEATVRACEQELQVLRAIGLDSGRWWSGMTSTEIRAKYLLERMGNAQATLQKLEKQNRELKKVLAHGA